MKQVYENCPSYRAGCFKRCELDCNLKDIAAETERKHQEWLASRKDYSQACTHDDDNDPLCWQCTNFVFPIGCMLGEE
jgi:hypothetical protein